MLEKYSFKYRKTFLSPGTGAVKAAASYNPLLGEMESPASSS